MGENTNPNSVPVSEIAADADCDRRVAVRVITTMDHAWNGIDEGKFDVGRRSAHSKMLHIPP